MDAFQIAHSISKNRFFPKKNLLTKKGFTVDYILYRILRPLLKVYYKLFKMIHPACPWTSQASILTFDKILTKEMIGFEYGSGNSSVFFAKRIKHLTSIEHNETWFNIVSSNFKKLNLYNVDYRLVPPTETKESNSLNTFYRDYNLNETDFQIRFEYQKYFSVISQYPNEHFDFIMVDGRARVECCLNAIPKLKQKGIFVLDNSDRERYRPVFKVLSAWKQVTTTTGLFDTTIWFKP